jgi:hypothetical protein
LGVRSTTIEVNPFLADLIEAKLVQYDPRAIARDYGKLVRAANKRRLGPARFYSSAPATFVEPGLNGRWLFNESVAARNPQQALKVLTAFLGASLLTKSHYNPAANGTALPLFWFGKSA